MAEVMPPWWFVEALDSFARVVFRHTGERYPISQVAFSTSFGVRLGVAPGHDAHVITSVGRVAIATDESPYQYGHIRCNECGRVANTSYAKRDLLFDWLVVVVDCCGHWVGMIPAEVVMRGGLTTEDIVAPSEFARVDGTGRSVRKENWETQNA